VNSADTAQVFAPGLKTGAQITVVKHPIKTRNLFGPVEEIAGKTLRVLERNPQGDCLCLFVGVKGQKIVDVDHSDVEPA
jgi:hypothetical protein